MSDYVPTIAFAVLVIVFLWARYKADNE